MSQQQNPFGLHTVTPYLVVRDAERMTAFIEKHLNGTVRGDIRRREDGSVQHMEMTLGDSVIMMGETTAEFPHIKATASAFYIYIDDCDSTYKAALADGLESIADPVDYDHGDRLAGFKDPEGNSWWVVTHIGKQ